MKLTKSIIEKATYEGKRSEGRDGKVKWSRCVIWDDEIRGLGVRITPMGKKSFVLLYRPEGSPRQRFMTLGSVGPLTLDQARKKALRERAKALDGRDPLDERRSKRDAENAVHLGNQTIAGLTKLYLDYSSTRKKESSLRNDRQMIRDYVIPQLGKKKLEDVRRVHIVDVHQSLKDRPYAANRLLALLKRMFNLAKSWDDRPKGSEPLVNPCDGVEPFAEKARERYLSPEELARLGRILSRGEEKGSISGELVGEDRDIPLIASAVTAIRLILFTGCRREEILALKWDHVDLDHHRITLLDSKVGSRFFPIGAAAVEVLANAQRKEGNPYVCWGRKKGGKLVGLPKIWRYIRTAANIEDVRIHDLRHTFGSVGVGAAGLNLPMVGKLLGHTQAATTQRYAHVADVPAKAAADRVSEEIAARLGGGAVKTEVDPDLVDLVQKLKGLSEEKRRALLDALG